MFYIFLNFMVIKKIMLTNKHIDHTFLKPDTQLNNVEMLCEEAIAHGFSTICVLPLFVNNVKKITASVPIKVATVIGFPLGHHAIEAKMAEIVLAILDGADELEMVINSSAIKNKDWQYLAAEINTVLPIIKNKGKIVTVILETGLMTDEEIIAACDLYGAAGVDYIKTGTGYIEDENFIERIKFIRCHLAGAIKIKATSRILNFKFADKLIAAGANKLSCTNGIELITEAIQQN